MEKSSPVAVTIYAPSEARAIARSARQVARKQLAQFRRPRRMAIPVDLDGLMKKYGIPSTLSRGQTLSYSYLMLLKLILDNH